MTGAWIFPDGSIHETTNAQSHVISLKNLGLEKNLLDLSKTMDWTMDELDLGFNKDLACIALRLGYVRVTSFASSIAI